jgi:hypothetical protein
LLEAHCLAVGELPDKSIIWIKNTTTANIDCHGLDVGINNIAKPNDWCRAPKSNAINSGFSCKNERVSMLSPSIAVYCWQRKF